MTLFLAMQHAADSDPVPAVADALSSELAEKALGEAVDAIEAILGAPLSEQHPCARCGSMGLLWPAEQIVSANFGSWDDHVVSLSAREGSVAVETPPDRQRKKKTVVGWCKNCSLVLKTPGILSRPWQVVARPSQNADRPSTLAAARLSRQQVGELLTRPIPADMALSYPLRRRKHIVPSMRFGYVVTDTGRFRWGRAETQLAAVYQQFRQLGVSRQNLEREAPPLTLFVSAVKEHPATDLLQQWAFLAQWRKTPQWELVSYVY